MVEYCLAGYPTLPAEGVLSSESRVPQVRGPQRRVFSLGWGSAFSDLE